MTFQKMLRMACLFALLPLLLPGPCPLPLVAATLDTLDKQRQQTPPEPKAQPPLRLQEEESRQPALDRSLRFTLASLRLEGCTVFNERELLAPYAASTARKSALPPSTRSPPS